jgi:hypothetical protein
MRVFFDGQAMRGPPGMADARGGQKDVLAFEPFFQVVELALGAHDMQLPCCKNATPAES